jgi:EpsI family protein
MEFEMKPFERRIWLTAVLMSVCYVCILWVRTGYTFEVIPLKQSLAAVPMEMDGWRGQDVPIDEEVLKILNAQETLNRIYRNIDGSTVVCHISAWLRPDSVSEVAPHIPKLCYTTTGWSILGEKQVPIKTPEGDMTLTALLLERQEDRIVVGYWYQMGSANFTTVEEARAIHRGLWGKTKWPATVKVLVQTQANTIEAAMPAIERFVTQIRRQVTDGSSVPPAAE